MTTNILQFIPRANPKADRAFWKGGDSPIVDKTKDPDPPIEEYVKSAGYPVDTAPSEMNPEEPK